MLSRHFTYLTSQHWQKIFPNTLPLQIMSLHTWAFNISVLASHSPTIRTALCVLILSLWQHPLSLAFLALVHTSSLDISSWVVLHNSLFFSHIKSSWQWRGSASCRFSGTQTAVSRVVYKVAWGTATQTRKNKGFLPKKWTHFSVTIFS